MGTNGMAAARVFVTFAAVFVLAKYYLCRAVLFRFCITDFAVCLELIINVFFRLLLLHISILLTADMLLGGAH